MARAVITGLGVVSPIGTGAPAFRGALLAGGSGLGPPGLFDPARVHPDCRAVGEVRGWEPEAWMPPAVARTAARFTQFALAASRLTLEDAALDPDELPRERTAVARRVTRWC
jgi:3-oxoacyl-[acyl-carrier-protein] synthase II